MDEIHKSSLELKQKIEQAFSQLDIEGKSKELDELSEVSQTAEFWQDNIRAQNVMQKISSLNESIQPWQELKNSVDDVIQLSKTDDAELKDELSTQLKKANADFDKLKSLLKYSGPFDDHNVILSIHAGAGGTDAQDWAQMLLRMYTRFSEKNAWQAKVIEESAGEEAGIKSVTLEMVGQNAYGKLRSEHGVHRLVRLSPFNSDNLRQTSFAKVEVMPMIDKPEELELDEKDLKIDVYRSGGHGGQSVNTTDSAVRITHIPTGITVAIQNERSQLQNRETALTILRSRLAQLRQEQHLEQISELKGPNQSAEWGNQIRSYVLHPYKQVKDLRTRYETSNPDAVLDGELDGLIDAYLDHTISADS